MTDAILTARSFLFVPGDRPERLLKAVQSGADAIIVDFEDAVNENNKDHARRSTAQKWREMQSAADVPILIRVNAFGSEAWKEDVEILHALPGLAGIVLPKTESSEELIAVHSHFPVLPILPLIESARGWASLGEISQAPGVARLVLGHLDFISDTGMSPSPDESELAPLRFAIVMHARLARLAAPVDGVTVQTEDADAVMRDTLRARRFGFGGKLCIHPRQVPGIHAGFRPSAVERQWAERVLSAAAEANGAAVLVDGRMVDRPVILKAQTLLAMPA